MPRPATAGLPCLFFLALASFAPGLALADSPPASEPAGTVTPSQEGPLSDASFLDAHQPEGAPLEGSEVSFSDEEFVIVLLGAVLCALLIIAIV